ncbi:nicotinamide-nucleotide amidohydrolase family protein [Candidatus Fermentibacterales bacterium]|nr:nicotinamide-nucleotide amidohydrolase family protein [Candidatus Fermentibacterales bacterium]
MTCCSDRTRRMATLEHAWIVLVGDELLEGRTRDVNLSECARFLESGAGLRVGGCSVLPDSLEQISGEISRLIRPGRLIVTTGGLGPTDDDMTSAAVAQALGRQLERNADASRMVRARFEARGEEVPPVAWKQAMMPVGSIAFPNGPGIAPGILLERDGCAIACLPGVPSEVRSMLPGLLEVLEGRGWISPDLRSGPRTGLLRTWGLREVHLYERLSPAARRWGCDLAFLPSVQMVDVKISGEAEAVLRAGDAMAEELGCNCYSTEPGVTLCLAAGRQLMESGLSVSVAESCTAGLLGAELTSEPGSSDWFRGGVLSYSDEVKARVLGVSEESLSGAGAVSREVVEQMASGVRRLTGSGASVAVSGIAGPGGGSEQKPVGTVWIALECPGTSRAALHRFYGDRERVRRAAVVNAMGMLYSCLRELRSKGASA